MKTVIFRLKYSNAAVIRAKIKPLLHRSAKVISFRENNILAVTANPRTLESISQLIKAVELIESEKVDIFKDDSTNTKMILQIQLF